MCCFPFHELGIFFQNSHDFFSNERKKFHIAPQNSIKISGRKLYRLTPIK